MPECYVDTNLIEYLLAAKVNHQHCCSKVVGPAIDGFVLDCAKDLDLKLEDFGLPSALKEFTKVTKLVSSNADKRFKNLFKDLEQHREISILKQCLLYLSNEKYQIKVDTLKEIFLEC